MAIEQKAIERQMQIMWPHTYNALTYLVAAMADTENNIGKKSSFGKDKGQEAYGKFLIALKNTLNSMILDGIISKSDNSEKVLVEIIKMIGDFSKAHPNWRDAYKFAASFFVYRNVGAIAVIGQLQSVP